VAGDGLFTLAGGEQAVGLPALLMSLRRPTWTKEVNSIF